MRTYNCIALAATEIMIPNKNIDMKRWSVIACDQYTSEIDYWNKCREEIGDAPSTLKLILPEVYLGIETKEQIDSRLSNILTTANSYLENNIWTTLGDGVILIDRSTSLHPSRKGLVAAIDLEKYSYEPGNKELIRATEGTVTSRIPPRVKIRANSPVELPHVMLLIDDPNGSVIEKAWNEVSSNGTQPIYDTDLFGISGHVTGYFVDSSSTILDNITDALQALLDKSLDGMLYAVGDGNHSLASAKAFWDVLKHDLPIEERETHPARYALVEIVNIHDKGLDFEPIHRVAFGISRDDFIRRAELFFKDSQMTISDKEVDGAQNITIVNENMPNIVLSLKKPPHTLAVGSIGLFLDSLENIQIDYIHGEDSVLSLAKGDSTGIVLPSISKDSFFETIAKEGVFPRKTFSMGEAFEKRFYLEAKRII